MHVRAVLKERSIERAEGIALQIQVAAQILFDCARVASEFGSETANGNAPGQLADGGKFRGKSPIDEYQLAIDSRNPKRMDVLWRGQGMPVASEVKRRLGDGARVGEAPVFVACGREACLAEARESLLAKLLQPGEVVANSGFFKSAEAFLVSGHGL
jgi:hypothetical protein